MEDGMRNVGMNKEALGGREGEEGKRGRKKEKVRSKGGERGSRAEENGGWDANVDRDKKSLSGREKMVRGKKEAYLSADRHPLELADILGLQDGGRRRGENRGLSSE
jgi:hypothetical protein